MADWTTMFSPTARTDEAVKTAQLKAMESATAGAAMDFVTAGAAAGAEKEKDIRTGSAGHGFSLGDFSKIMGTIGQTAEHGAAAYRDIAIAEAARKREHDWIMSGGASMPFYSPARRTSPWLIGGLILVGGAVILMWARRK